MRFVTKDIHDLYTSSDCFQHNVILRVFYPCYKYIIPTSKPQFITNIENLFFLLKFNLKYIKIEKYAYLSKNLVLWCNAAATSIYAI